MIGEPVLPEGLDIIRSLEQWLEQHPKDAMVRAKLGELQRDPRYAEPDEPDDIMPQVPELAEFPVPSRAEEVHRRSANRGRRQRPHVGRVRGRRIQPAWPPRILTSRAGPMPHIPPACISSRWIRKRLEKVLSLPGGHAGTRGSR